MKQDLSAVTLLKKKKKLKASQNNLRNMNRTTNLMQRRTDKELEETQKLNNRKPPGQRWQFRGSSLS